MGHVVSSSRAVSHINTHWIGASCDDGGKEKPQRQILHPSNRALKSPKLIETTAITLGDYIFSSFYNIIRGALNI